MKLAFTSLAGLHQAYNSSFIEAGFVIFLRTKHLLLLILNWLLVDIFSICIEKQ